MVGEIVPEERERQVGAVVPRRARYDAVEIVGIALRLAQPLIAAGRTAAEIILLRGSAIEGGGDRLCRDRRLMDGELAEIYDPVQVATAKDQVGAAVGGIGTNSARPDRKDAGWGNRVAGSEN